MNCRFMHKLLTLLECPCPPLFWEIEGQVWIRAGEQPPRIIPHAFARSLPSPVRVRISFS